MDFMALAPTASDAKLIDAVARIIRPDAFDDRPLLTPQDGKWVTDPVATKANNEINERNRCLAADIAIDIIRCVREHDQVAQR